ncbi:MAG: ADP-heptose:LPS heptosyltransferase [Solidesulfovibrio magneticus str. Maddingley MBC34]|uniref:ADP-heptose:LPS heptosyltransferase n=1 Tax=Solidesulfovibrio magneticus str. Maddingley MBC34 TaxID=1206767 RepID=K6FLP2_9BACT|nr:MAG: ADP-heptose:LPS heptosyltransferase [Solidesulfovibrio magneticus str. Maddingley MBC34]
MADPAPIVVIQPQRMGDLILTYPLLLWLARSHAGRPVTVVADPAFARPLAPISPQAKFMSLPQAAAALPGREHELVINLGIVPEAARLAGAIPAARRLGPAVGPDGAVRIGGDWQLYRSSVVHLNRHSRYHWAELSALDIVPPALLAGTAWPAPRQGGPGRRKVGLFLGASQPEKRPGPAFFAALARELVRRGLVPVLLGGPDEAGLGDEAARLAGIPLSNLCGQLGLKELAFLGQEMALLVTPDTGPMHLAAWTGWRTLNLSVGPVSPHETGPYQPGHYVLRPRLSCRGCWECFRESVVCRDRLDPVRVGYVAARLARGEDERLAGASIPAFELLRTAVDPYGLRVLEPVSVAPGPVPSAGRELLGDFWRAVFGHVFGVFPETAPRLAAAALAQGQPALHAALGKKLGRLGAALARDTRRGAVPDAAFAAGFAPGVAPLAGYIERLLQNGDGSRPARLAALALYERAASLFAG